MTRLDVILTLGLSIFFATLFFEATHYKWQAAAAPLLATGAGLLLTVLLLRELLRSDSLETPQKLSEKYNSKDMRAVFGFTAAIISILLLGFTIGSTIFVIVYFYYFADQKLTKAVIYSLPIPVFMEYVIQYIVRIDLYDGYIFSLG